MLRQIIEDQFEQFRNEDAKSEGELITRKEACSMLKISLPTLDKYSKNSTLKSYTVGNRVLYKKGELIDFVESRNFSKV